MIQVPIKLKGITMKTKNLKHAILLATILVLIVASFSAKPALASVGRDEEPPSSGGEDTPASGMDGAFDEVLDTIKGLGETIIKFMIYVGGIVFTVGFVYSAMTGTIGQAIGNQMGVSSSVVKGISVLLGFIFLLSSFNIGAYVAESITDKAVSDNREWADFDSLRASGGAGDYSDVAPDQVLQTAEIQGVIVDLADAIVKFMLGIGGVAFMVGIVRGAFDTQLGTLLGGAGMASQGIMRAIGAVMTFLVLATAFTFSQNLVSMLVPRLVGNIAL